MANFEPNVRVVLAVRDSLEIPFWKTHTEVLRVWDRLGYVGARRSVCPRLTQRQRCSTLFQQEVFEVGQPVQNVQLANRETGA